MAYGTIVEFVGSAQLLDGRSLSQLSLSLAFLVWSGIVCHVVNNHVGFYPMS